MCNFCNNLREQKKANHETGALYKYYADLVTVTMHGGLHRSVGRQNSKYELNYCPECGKKLSQLKACPFCEMEVARVAKEHELKSNNGRSVCVVCDVHEGGCGATGGYSLDEAEAIEKWNRRGGK